MSDYKCGECGETEENCGCCGECGETEENCGCPREWCQICDQHGWSGVLPSHDRRRR